MRMQKRALTLWIENADGEGVKIEGIRIGNDLAHFVDCLDVVAQMLSPWCDFDLQICFNPEEGGEENA